MNNKIKFLALGICVMNLSSCMVSDENIVSYQSYTYYNDSQLYPQNYYSSGSYIDSYKYNNHQPQEVTVPDSYHVGQYHSPVSFKDRDKNWVKSQNPQGYTIEIADEEQAATVAQKLYKAPKNDRIAQVKYQRNGKPYYKGLYGSYNNPADAKKAMDALPPDLKQKAGVKEWGSVQGNLDE